MAGKAKTLSSEQFNSVLAYVVGTSPNPFRDAVVLLLSFRAGLRVGEIAGLSWRDVTDARGALSANLELPAGIAKCGSARSIPMHSELREALSMLQEALGPDNTRGNLPVVRAAAPRKGGFRMDPNTLQRYISRTYTAMGLSGCSSHSGRRTFITSMSRIHNTHDCSLHDVQRLAGHRQIDTTERYIEPSEGVAAMVESL